MSRGDAPPLTVARRSCLLRAARERLKQLHEDYDASHERGDIGSKRDAMSVEITCITAAISWLWVQPAIDDAG